MVDVSVIVPVHNGAAFLDETERQLTALLEASSLSVEIIAIDDHSTDTSLEIISAWPGRMPAVRILHAEERGVARARNQAVAVARGDYVWFTDADDAWSPFVVDALFAAATRSGADLVVANATKVLANGDLALIEDAPEEESYDARETFRRVLEGRVQGHLWNKLFSRELLGRDPFPTTRAHSDLGGVLGVIPRVTRTVALPESLYEYVIRPGSILNTSSYRWQDLHDCLAIAVDVSQRLGQPMVRELARFAGQNVAIPVANECLRRREWMDPKTVAEAMRQSRKLITIPVIAAFVRARKLSLAGRLVLLRFAPSVYAYVYRRASRASSIATDLPSH